VKCHAPLEPGNILIMWPAVFNIVHYNYARVLSTQMTARTVITCTKVKVIALNSIEELKRVIHLKTRLIDLFINLAMF
jgi:hypothetical protein